MRQHVRWGKRMARLAMIGAASVAGPRMLEAQAWDYPSFQQSHIVNREFVAAVANAGNGGTDFLFQWHEGVSTQGQFTLDAGFVASALVSGHDLGFFGGDYAYQLARPTPSLPIEILGTAGLGFAFGNGVTYMRIPVGVSVGHQFPIGAGMTLTPFAEPMVGIDFCNSCGTADRGRSELGVGLDLGANVDLSSMWSVRMAVGLGSTSVIARDNSFGVGLAWRPPVLIPR